MKISEFTKQEYKDGYQTWCHIFTDDRYVFDARVLYNDKNNPIYITESPPNPEMMHLIKMFVGRDNLYKTTDEELFEIIKSKNPYIFLF